ncbi:MAG: ABC transporter ATP-binding protein [Clostridiales bacterium]|nr:ABC transporter ATP-binding protein [Clostridiales bacterium]
MEELLNVRNLRKQYGEKLVVEDVSYVVNSGEIVGLIGPNGAGKSTMIKILADVEEKTDGEILFHKASIANQVKKYKSKLGIVPQDIAIYEDLSAYDNVKFFCSLYGYKKQEVKERAQEALEFVGLWERRKEMPGKFSGGMKRRLNIACSIAHSPELLIMDEPTVGIDPQSRNHIMESIKKLNAKGTTVIYVSHYMEEIEEICNRIIIMDHGRILEDEAKDKFKEKYRAKNLNRLEDIFLYLTGTKLRDEEE